MRSILITGGTGTFGQAFVKLWLSRWKSDRVVILSRSEHAQADMALRYNNDDRLRFFIGDVRDRDRLRRAFNDVEIIIHAAALKRIEVGYYNPNEMVKTNVIGTMNVIEAAMDAGVKQVIGISSDKAWQPISPYGQTKALAETLMLNANHTGGSGGPAFNIVRYGNVAGSNGSVIPKWAQVLKTKNPIVISDPDCTRFWMMIEDATHMVYDIIMRTGLDKYKKLPGQEIYTPRLSAFRIGDLAEVMGAKDTKVTGLPAWEKMHEGMSDGDTSDVAPRMTEDQLAAGVRSILCRTEAHV